MEKAVEEATATHERVVSDAAGIRAECETLQKEMDDVGGEPLKALRALVKSLNAEIVETGDAATAKRATAASHAKATARLAKAIEEATAEREKLTEDIKATKEAFKALEDGAMEVLESQKALQARCDEKGSELAAAAAERDDALKVVGAVKHAEVDIVAKLDDLRATAKENEDKAAHWGKELEKCARSRRRSCANGRGAEERVRPPLLTPKSSRRTPGRRTPSGGARG